MKWIPDDRSLKERIRRIVFDTDTILGWSFDVLLIISIITSLIAVMLESVSSIFIRYGTELRSLEWFFTVLFTLEFILRLFASSNKKPYFFSFFGIVDFLAILPAYLELLFPGSHYLLVIRTLRMLRIFRILKLTKYTKAAGTLTHALVNSKQKIIVFLASISILVVILGSLMYVIEGERNGFTSIPVSIYWAIVTLTTVGYGDISPRTPLGQFFASIVMILGYAIIAVPTGVVSVEYARTIREEEKKEKEENQPERRKCSGCDSDRHDADALYCKYCGDELPDIE